MRLRSIKEKPVSGTGKRGIYHRFVKRPMDAVLSFLALVVFSPLMVIVALLVRIKLGKPVIFTQERPGFNEKIFTLYKFRTMTDEKDKNGELLPDALRLTKFGRMLRSTSLDELPELINILKGDMSIIGPRPLLVQYIPYYSEIEHRRHSVKPGLTGLAQINGRNLLSWDKRLEKDIEYVDKVKFISDIKILVITVMKVLSKKDILTDTDEIEGNLAVIRAENQKQLGQTEVFL
jgi:lipopolysaccharide/colanic/teichoic acid biosynthesis glycosyltransferase